jgi:Bacterial SH3 domain
MKARSGVFHSITVLLLAVVFTACTSAEQKVVVIPTLAVLPGETVTLEYTLTPAFTRPPTITPTPTLSPYPATPSTSTFTPLPPCDVARWWTTVSPTVVQFFDTLEVASVTARASLSPILLELRQVWREFERADYPDCAKPIHDAVVAGMADTADGFNQFLAQQDASGAILQRAALRFSAVADVLIRYSVVPDNRLITMAYDWGGIPDAQTATWIFMPYIDRATLAAATSAALATGISQAATDAAATHIVQSLTPPPPTLTPTVARGQFFHVIVSMVGLRSCPRSNCSNVGVLIQNDVVTIVDAAQGDEISGSRVWYFVHFRSLEGYVHSSMLAPG